jgi:hypothetical protein
VIRWLIRLAILAVILVGIDRLALGLAQGKLATELQRAESLQQRPSVHIEGFPFITQVVAGRYDDVRVDVKGLVKAQLTISDLQVHAEGVQVAFADAVAGRVSEVPVARGTIRATIAFSSIDAAFASYGSGLVMLRTSSAGAGRVRLDGALTLPGGPYRVSGVADVALNGGRLKVTPAPDLFGLLPAAVRSQAQQLLTPALPLPTLPFGVRLESAEVRSDGIVLTARAKGIVLHTRAG